jgi:hypothetical protein
MKKLTNAQVFAAPKRADKARLWLERAKVVVVAAREQAAEAAQQCPVPSVMRPPTVLQRRRLIGKFSGTF